MVFMRVRSPAVGFLDVRRVDPDVVGVTDGDALDVERSRLGKRRSGQRYGFPGAALVARERAVLQEDPRRALVDAGHLLDETRHVHRGPRTVCAGSLREDAALGEEPEGAVGRAKEGRNGARSGGDRERRPVVTVEALRLDPGDVAAAFRACRRKQERVVRCERDERSVARRAMLLHGTARVGKADFRARRRGVRAVEHHLHEDLAGRKADQSGHSFSVVVEVRCADAIAVQRDRVGSPRAHRRRSAWSTRTRRHSPRACTP